MTHKGKARELSCKHKCEGGMKYINDMCVHCLTDYTCEMNHKVCDGVSCHDYKPFDGELD